MLRHVGVSVRMMALLLLVLGLAFPLAVTAVAQVVFPKQANGSLVYVDDRPVGSALVGQSFTAEKYFQPRPSYAGTGYDPNASSSSNMGPTNQTLIDSVESRVTTATLEDPRLARGNVPVDMVTGSASGLDPDISVANALAQAPRVARVRGTSLESVDALIWNHVEGRTLGLLGDPRVNVLEINLALDGTVGK